MSSPLISVIIPTFNRAYSLPRAINSALNQTHGNVEVIVVDDGSTDETEELTKSTYATEPRVRMVRQANAGVSAARNHGLALAKGEFISFLDSDDEWYLWKLSVELACLNFVPDAGMIWTDMDAIGPDGTVVKHKYLKTMYGAYQRLGERSLFDRSWDIGEVIPDGPADIRGARLFAGDIFSEMILGNLVHTSTVLLRRDRLQLVRDFNVNLKVSGEDYDFHLRTCREGPVAFLDASSIRYQIGMGDALTRPELMIHLALNNLQTILSVLKTDKDRIRLPEKTINERIASSYFWIGQAYLDLAEPHKARPFLLRGLLRSPYHLRPWERLILSCFPKRLRSHIMNLVHVLKRTQKT
jgi:glycosyltransferase involved in cell wall biosynthesis